jgi:hypothetical protein
MTNPNTMSFVNNERIYQTRIFSLLKDGWIYDNRKKINGEIGIQGNDRFNSAPPKMLHLQVNKGGSEMRRENVKIELYIENIPDELIYGLWSLVVGNRAITSYPIIFDNCYTHLPDFSNPKTIEILSYTVLSSLITEIKSNNCDGKIGFIGMRKVFKFGGEELTRGSQYLIDTYRDCKIGEHLTIGNVFDRLKEREDPDDIDKKLRIMIKQEIETRLEEIGYWDFLPIPDVFTESEDELDENQETLF